MKKQINRAVLKIKPWNISQTFLPGCGCKACYHSEVSKQVTLKETSPFSYRTSLLPWGPHFAGPGTKPEAGAGGSTGDTSHQVLSLSACLGNEGTAQSHYFTHYTQFIWGSTTAHSIQQRALTMHSSLMSTHAGREALRSSHREQRGKGRLFRRNFTVYFY